MNTSGRFHPFASCTTADTCYITTRLGESDMLSPFIFIGSSRIISSLVPSMHDFDLPCVQTSSLSISGSSRYSPWGHLLRADIYLL